MLQQLRDQTGGFGFKLIVGLLIFVLAVFGFGGINLLAPSSQMASVNGVDIPRALVEREAQLEVRRIASQFGENFDPNLINAEQLQASVVNRLVTQELLLQNAADLGMGVSEAQAKLSIAKDPNFALDGKFDEGTYRRLVRNINQTPQGFVAETRRNLLLQQVNRAITDSALLPDWELRQMASVVGQTRDIGHLSFTSASFADQVEVTAAEVEQAYQENQRAYMTAETLDVAYVEFSWQSLLQVGDQTEYTVTDEDALTAYNSELELAVAAEQRDSSHILLQINDERDEAAALAQIQAIADRINNGEDFAELATQLSEDPGSKRDGGKLGLVGQGVFDPAFEAALWALNAPGEVSAPVKSAFGYHLIRLEAVQEAAQPTFEERKAELVASLQESRARANFSAKLRELDRIAFEQPDSLDGVVEAIGAPLVTVTGVAENSGTAPFDVAATRASVFAEKVLTGDENTPALDLGDERGLIARVVQRYEPELRPLADVQSDIEAQLRQDKAQAAANLAFASALSRVEAGESVVDVAQDYNLTWQSGDAVPRTSVTMPQEIVTAAFALPPPSATAKVVGSAELASGGNAIVTVTALRDGDYGAMTERERQGLQSYLNNRAAQLDFVSLYTSFEDAASIDKPEAG